MEKKTFEEVARMWQGEKKELVKLSTYAAYSLLIENHLLPSFGREHDITESMVQAFVFRKLRSGLSPKSVKDILIVLKMVLKFAAKHGLMPHRDISVRFPTERARREVDVLSVRNQQKIMRHLRDNFSFMNMGIYMCLCSGLRIGEVCALKWEDIDMDSGIIRVSKTIQRIYVPDGGSRRTELIIGPAKTANSIRSIPIATDLAAMLRRMISEASVPGSFILTNAPTPIEPRTYRNHYNRLIHTLGLPKIKFHGLRHSFATRCIESQCDYKTVSAILGHANISTTLNLYVHPNHDQKQRCVEQMLQRLK